MVRRIIAFLLSVVILGFSVAPYAAAASSSRQYAAVDLWDFVTDFLSTDDDVNQFGGGSGHGGGAGRRLDGDSYKAWSDELTGSLGTATVLDDGALVFAVPITADPEGDVYAYVEYGYGGRSRGKIDSPCTDEGTSIVLSEYTVSIKSSVASLYERGAGIELLNYVVPVSGIYSIYRVDGTVLQRVEKNGAFLDYTTGFRGSFSTANGVLSAGAKTSWITVSLRKFYSNRGLIEGIIGPIYVKCIPSDPSVSSPPSSSRISDLMQTIADFFSPDRIKNFVLGKTDSSGNITNIYNTTNIFSESTKIFTEPVTGTQYQCKSWAYDYTNRVYDLTLESGTFYVDGKDIDRIDLTYGENALQIRYFSSGSLVSSEKFAYVTATNPNPGQCAHEYESAVTTDPTCTAAGVRTYTCTICDHTYTETISALGHDWRKVRSVDATFNEDGSVDEYGYILYECARCKEQYKDYATTGPPVTPGGGSGSGSGGSGSGSSGSGDSFWQTIKNAFADSLGTILGTVLDFIAEILGRILDLVKELLGFLFGLLDDIVLGGIRAFFKAIRELAFDAFLGDDGSYQLPDGVPQVFQFFSGVFGALPPAVAAVCILGVVLVVLFSVFRLVG